MLLPLAGAEPPDLARICRPRFPALELRVNGHPAAFFDGPGGTQVPDTVIAAITEGEELQYPRPLRHQPGH